MALGSDVLRLIVDADTSGAVSEFKKLGATIETSGDKAATGFKGSLARAFDGLQAKSSTVSGIFDKIGLSSSQAAGVISAAIPAAGVAAAGALVAFAAKGIKAFQETALAAGKFADTTGLSVETASRYVAIADDIGVGAGTIQNAFVKMEKAMGANKSAFTGLIATAKGGGTDLSQTFLNAVTHLQGIQDPIKRATEASKLFGKGFSEVSELISTDAGKIKDSLSKVSDSQVITPGELAKAREYRAAMDNLGDSVRDLSIDIGQVLVPSLASGANALASFINGTKDLNRQTGGVLGDLGNSFLRMVDPIKLVKDSYGQFLDLTKTGGGGGASAGFDAIAKSASEMGAAIGPAGTSVGDFGRAVTEHFTGAATSADVLTTSVSDLGRAIGPAGTSFGDLTRSAGSAVTSMDMISGSADAMAENIGHETEALQHNRDAINEVHDALLKVNNTQLDAASLQQGVIDAMKTANEVHADRNKTVLEGQVADDKAAQSALQLAENQRQIAKDSGAADEGQKAFIDTLKFISNSAAPGVKQEIDKVIQSYVTFGQQHPEATATANNTDAIQKVSAAQQAANTYGRTVATAAIHADDQASGKISNVKSGVDNLRSGVTVNVGANTSAARSAINGLINGLNSISSITGHHFATIAKGTRDFAGGLALVGERGPEMVFLPQHSAVKTAGETKKIMDGPSPLTLSAGGQGSGTVVQITVNGAVDPYSTARQIQTILAKGGYAGFSAKAA